MAGPLLHVLDARSHQPQAVPLQQHAHGNTTPQRQQEGQPGYSSWQPQQQAEPAPQPHHPQHPNQLHLRPPPATELALYPLRGCSALFPPPEVLAPVAAAAAAQSANCHSLLHYEVYAFAVCAAPRKADVEALFDILSSVRRADSLSPRMLRVSRVMMTWA